MLRQKNPDCRTGDGIGNGIPTDWMYYSKVWRPRVDIYGKASLSRANGGRIYLALTCTISDSEILDHGVPMHSAFWSSSYVVVQFFCRPLKRLGS